MIIRIDNIPEEGQRIEGKIDPSAMQLDMPGYSLTEALAIAGRATRSGEDVMLEGNLTGSVESQCGRCLSYFKMPVDVAVDVVFAPRREPSGEQTEVIDTDVNISYYDGNSIDLSQEMNDVILVNLPIKPICREDCKGLCPQCGVDLNTAPCRCGGDKGPSPFDKLKELKAELEKE